MYGGPPPSAPTPWLQPADRYTGSCESEDGANFLLIEPIGSARRLNPSPDAGWGLHLADVNIALGELGGLVASQSRSYLAQPPRPCLDRRGRIEPPRIGRLRIGRSREQLLSRTAVTPARRAPWSSRWCTDGFSGGLHAVFSARSDVGRARLLVTTAPGYEVAGVGPGRRLRAFRRRFPAAVPLGGGTYRAAPGSTLFFGVGRGGTRVRYVGVARRRLLADRRRLDRDLDRAGLPFPR